VSGWWLHSSNTGRKLNNGDLLLWTWPQVPRRPSVSFQQLRLRRQRYPRNSCAPSIPSPSSATRELGWSLQSSSPSSRSPRTDTGGHARSLTVFLPTPFVWLQLCLQVLWRDVVLLLFAFRRFRFTLPAAAITAAAQTATAIAAGDEPAEHKQGLQKTGAQQTFITCAYHAWLLSLWDSAVETRDQKYSNLETELRSYFFFLYFITKIYWKICAKLAAALNISHWGEYCQPGLL